MSTFMSRLRALAACVGLGAALAVAATSNLAAQEFKQIELSEKMVTSFIAAQKDFAPLASKLVDAGDNPGPELTKELETIAKKHGFASFDEFEDVGANITLVLDGLDRTTGKFTDPIEKMKQELEEIKADTSIPAEDKKLAVDDLTQEIAASQPLQHQSNIDVVKKHVEEIEALIPDEAGESPPDDEAPAP